MIIIVANVQAHSKWSAHYVSLITIFKITSLAQSIVAEIVLHLDQSNVMTVTISLEMVVVHSVQ